MQVLCTAISGLQMNDVVDIIWMLAEAHGKACDACRKQYCMVRYSNLIVLLEFCGVVCGICKIATSI